MMLSELDLEDVEALHSGSSFLTADTLGPLLDHCDEALFGLSSLEEPLSPTSPVHSHHAPLPEAKASDLMLPWLGASDLLDIECPQEEDALLAMEWVSEKLELGELDLDSLLDSSDDCPDSPYSPDAAPAPCSQPDLTPALTFERPEGAVKTEPLSPALSPELSPELGSEVELGQDLAEGPSHSHSDSDSDSGIESSPPHTPQSCRSKPYSRPHPDTKPSRPHKPVKTVEKKLKKMEQNKTAATRYRQKKRVEQEELNAECLLLEQKNQELSERAQALSKEIQYLKDLMEEVRRHHQSKTRTATK